VNINKQVLIDKIKDDGDANVYKNRLDQYYQELEQNLDYKTDCEKNNDVEINDGLKIPGKIWFQLYEYV
jgi:hypothetical protein